MTQKVPYALVEDTTFADIASAATINLDTAAGRIGRVTGTTGITAVTLAADKVVWVQFTGALILTHNGASLILPTSANITTAAGDWALFARINGIVTCVFYSRATGSPLTIAGTLGTVTQVVNTQSGALVTGSTVTPIDDTIPQSGEGTAIPALDTAFTPKSTTSLLRIDAVVMASVSVLSYVILGLFKDAGANALAVASEYTGAATGLVCVKLTWFEVSGSLTARTYKLRAGNSSAGTISINGSSGARVFGGVCNSSLTVTEISA